MAGANIEIAVDGRWLTLECMYGDIEMSTVWPGGSDELSWALGTQPTRRFRGGELVSGHIGGSCVWSGSLLEPDESQDRMTAQGAWREADGYMALTSGGLATAVPDTAIDQAIARGLKWTRPISISSAATELDVSSGPARLGALLDAYAENSAKRWSVTPGRIVSAAADPTVPTYQTLPLDGGLGYALDNYASQLFGRYVNSAGGALATTSSTDATADNLHGHREDVVDLTPKGPISTARAQAILAGLLATGRSTPKWTASIDLAYGELLNMGGVPVALETVAAGSVVRIHGGFELAQRLNGAMFIDVLIGQTDLSAGNLTLQPMQVATRTFVDALAAAMSKK